MREYLDVQEAVRDTLVTQRLTSLVSTRLTVQQLRAIAVLMLDEGLSAHQLAKALGVSPATVSGILDRLEAGGLVRRRTDEKDGRVRRIAVTDQGVTAVRRIVADDTAPGPETLHQLSTEDLERSIPFAISMLRAAQANATVASAEDLPRSE
ncbi:DNA-binding transcriptional regulator, MarR family [Paraoerskovia marina]|uniref:DNA-binding transcriptional regulator, MarR family n=1 Tax=Paraoerskovia marina TaxID=545619 RepID=A0A1H1QJS6_9CELL|nr:DNA-binding transcriptional regulator, MarR family [Paraoerskovia marina]